MKLRLKCCLRQLCGLPCDRDLLTLVGLSTRPSNFVSIKCSGQSCHSVGKITICVAYAQGMYKSKLECPQCSHVGVKFDPYMYLSLNLPESKRRTLHVTALYVDGSQPPLQHAVDVPKTGELLLWAKVTWVPFS